MRCLYREEMEKFKVIFIEIELHVGLAAMSRENVWIIFIFTLDVALFRWYINSMNEFNFIIDNGHQLPQDDVLFFQGDHASHLESSADMWDVLKICGIFLSKGQARKDKAWGEKRDIPLGWSDFEIGKKKIRICILNPKQNAWRNQQIPLYLEYGKF